jgi:hypothetical protein
MVLQLGALRDALLDAGARPEKADKAAEELAGYEREFAAVRGDIAGVRSDLRTAITDARSDLRTAITDVRSDLRTAIADVRSDLRTAIADVQADIRLLKWGQATTFGGVAAILLKLFIH